MGGTGNENSVTRQVYGREMIKAMRHHEVVNPDQSGGQRVCVSAQTLASRCAMSVCSPFDRTEFAPRFSTCKMSPIACCHSGNFLLACSKSSKEVLTVAKKFETNAACFWTEFPLTCGSEFVFHPVHPDTGTELAPESYQARCHLCNAVTLEFLFHSAACFLIEFRLMCHEGR